MSLTLTAEAPINTQTHCAGFDCQVAKATNANGTTCRAIYVRYNGNNPALGKLQRDFTVCLLTHALNEEPTSRIARAILVPGAIFTTVELCERTRNISGRTCRVVFLRISYYLPGEDRLSYHEHDLFMPF